ncbi:hypothetical protein AaE_007580 [Aphanomyces astaci]|uniref:Uncharacterized protein n=1 Tax=Aphanomyces astaci TaxID=112090 RepID=A0A6A5AH44_APHAT|nr:hypothetical protein AaE_007580 [Aphanomyces astaci]
MEDTTRPCDDVTMKLLLEVKTTSTREALDDHTGHAQNVLVEPLSLTTAMDSTAVVVEYDNARTVPAVKAASLHDQTWQLAHEAADEPNSSEAVQIDDSPHQQVAAVAVSLPSSKGASPVRVAILKAIHKATTSIQSANPNTEASPRVQEVRGTTMTSRLPTKVSISDDVHSKNAAIASSTTLPLTNGSAPAMTTQNALSNGAVTSSSPVVALDISSVATKTPIHQSQLTEEVSASHPQGDSKMVSKSTCKAVTPDISPTTLMISCDVMAMANNTAEFPLTLCCDSEPPPPLHHSPHDDMTWRLLQQQPRSLADEIAMWEHWSSINVFDSTGGSCVPWDVIASFTGDQSSAVCRLDAYHDVPLVQPAALWRVLFSIYDTYKASKRELEWCDVQNLCKDCSLSSQHVHVWDLFDRLRAPSNMGLGFHEFYVLIAHLEPLDAPSASTTPLHDILLYYLLPGARRNVYTSGAEAAIERVAATTRPRWWSHAFKRLLYPRMASIKQVFQRFGKRPAPTTPTWQHAKRLWTDVAANQAKSTVDTAASPMSFGFLELSALLHVLCIVPELATEAHVRAQFNLLLDNQDESPEVSFSMGLAWVLELGMELLSYPVLKPIYPSDADKLLVMVDVWGLGDVTFVSNAT